MNRYGVSKSYYIIFLKNRKRALEFALKQGDPCSDEAEKRERTTGPKQNKTDEAVYQWYTQRSIGVPVRGVELQAAAERFRFQRVEVGFLDSVIGMVFQIKKSVEKA
jgi:hypothetical protein